MRTLGLTVPSFLLLKQTVRQRGTSSSSPIPPHPNEDLKAPPLRFLSSLQIEKVSLFFSFFFRLPLPSHFFFFLLPSFENPNLSYSFSQSKEKASGMVTYNGHKMDVFVPQRTSAYISQHDLHIGEMTVRETLAFSAMCQGVGTRYETLTNLSRSENAGNIKPDPDVDIYMKMLGLNICADTLVGNAMIRGISGGQKRRVTTGEMLVGTAKAMFMDEISTGLDSCTTFQIINSLQQTIHNLGGTALLSLLQPAPEIYDLFDDLIVLAEGHIVYQGPRSLFSTFLKPWLQIAC